MYVSVVMPAFFLIAQNADFYNYFQHGIDFFISSSTHVVKKIILHTNVVCVSLFFSFYSRTNGEDIARITFIPTI